MTICDLTTIDTVTLVGICAFLEAIARERFTLILNDSTFQISVVEAVALSPAFQE
jgi:hypothetical protein